MRSRNNSREDHLPLHEFLRREEDDHELSLEHGLAPPGDDKISLLLSRSSQNATVIPGRPKRRIKHTKKHTMTRKRRSLKSSWHHRLCLKCHQSRSIALLLAVLLWFSLGVVSISTSKVLLTSSNHHVNSPRYYYHVGGVPPLLLTMQQFLLGSTFLRLMLALRFLDSPGLQPWKSLCTLSEGSSGRSCHREKTNHQSLSAIFTLTTTKPNRHLLLAGISFTLGFVFTNLGFGLTTAAFVETIKAAEPITSAALAVSWGLERLTALQVSSLLSIVAGVILSTVGNSHTSSGALPRHDLLASLMSCSLVMASNLSFSFRGLHQKLFHREGGIADDLNLQFRMQQIGVSLLLLPTLVCDGPGVVEHIYRVMTTVGLLRGGVGFKYCLLAFVNGLAFASYNLASTYLLSRLSVTHHAALNCVRRIFAIVVTSVVFAVPITLVGSTGVVLSFFGFMVFTYSKTKRRLKSKPLSSLLPMGDEAEENHQA